MKVEFAREGGIAYFPGLSKPVTFDTNSLAPEDAQEFRRLLDEANFFDLPFRAGAPRSRGADCFQYTIHVESGDRDHTIQLTDPVQDPHQKALLNFITRKVRELNA